MSYLIIAKQKNVRKPIKIAITSKPSATAWYFQIMNNNKISLVAFSIPRDSIYIAMKKNFAPHHLGNDWFDITTTEIKKYVESKKSITKLPQKTCAELILLCLLT